MPISEVQYQLLESQVREAESSLSLVREERNRLHRFGMIREAVNYERIFFIPAVVKLEIAREKFSAAEKERGIIREHFEEVRRLERELGVGNTPEWEQRNRVVWDNLDTVRNYLLALKKHADDVNPHRLYVLERARIARESESSEKRRNEIGQARDMLLFKGLIDNLTEDVKIFNELSILVENNCASQEEAAKHEQIRLKMAEFGIGEGVEETALARKLDCVVNHWFDIQEEAKQMSEKPGEFQNAFTIHYNTLRISALRNLGIESYDENEREARDRVLERRGKFEEVRALAAELGMDSSQTWEHRDVAWWNNRENVEGYLVDLRNRVSLNRLGQ